MTLTYPYLAGAPGHEAAGDVIALGPGVTKLRVGARVAAWRDTGKPRQGFYAQFNTFHEDDLLALPATLELAAIAALELAMCVEVSFQQLAALGGIADRKLDFQGDRIREGFRYDVVGQPLLMNGIAATLPWFEVFCGLLLCLGIAVRGTALVSVVMLVLFTGLVLRRALALQAAEGIPFCAIRFDCGCGTGEVLICRKLGENLLLVLAGAILVGARSTYGALRHRLFETRIQA